MVNNAATTNADSARAADDRTTIKDSKRSSETVESRSSPNPKDVILFDGKERKKGQS